MSTWFDVIRFWNSWIAHNAVISVKISEKVIADIPVKHVHISSTKQKSKTETSKYQNQ